MTPPATQNPGLRRFADRFLLPTLAAVALALTSGAVPQGPDSAVPGLGELLGESARARLEDPALLRRVSEPPVAGRPLRLLEDADLRLEAFESHGSSDLALGFSFGVLRSLGAARVVDGPSYELVADGHVAFETDANPDDFLTGVVRVRWSGTRSLGDADARLDLAHGLEDGTDAELAGLDAERSSALATRLARGDAPEAVRRDPAYHALERAFLAQRARGLPTELAWDFDMHAGLETTQDFSSRRIVLGAALGTRLLAWDPSSAWSRYDVFDAPGALVRWLSGGDARLTAEAWPTVVLGLDVVDASRDELRGDLTTADSFLRARLELASRTEIAQLEDGPLTFTAGWRLFQELDAPAAVSAAGAHDASHFRAAFETPHGWVLSYTVGRLPLEQSYDSTFGVGYQVRW